MSSRKCTNSRGFALIELMLVLGLLAVFAVVATRVIVISLKTMAQSGDQHDQIVRFESAMSSLRRDAWSARQISSADPQAVSITNADGTVTWSIEKNALVRKSSNPQLMQRFELEAKLSFSVSGPTLTVSANESNGQSGQFQMFSPRLAGVETP
jgi:prepilin-type N-terminal cleavage/methylation domain-containing protein